MEKREMYEGKLAAELLFKAINEKYGYSKDEIRGGNQIPIPSIRRAFCTLLKENVKIISVKWIGCYINRDHSTVVYNTKKHLYTIGKDKHYTEVYNTLRAEIQKSFRPTSLEELYFQKESVLKNLEEIEYSIKILEEKLKK